MSVCASILCPECGKRYDDSERRTCIGKCKHLICLSCKNSLTPPNCPICDEADAFKETIYNLQVVNFLADFQECLSEADIEKFTNELQNLGHGPCSKCNIFTKKLRICTKCTPFVTPNGRGGWRPSYWLQGRNVCLKAKSLAICASCAVDHHEEHKLINLTIIDSISPAFEIEILLFMRYLIEKNWKKDVEEGRTTMEAVMPKSRALQWRLELRNQDIRDESLLNSFHLMSLPFCFPWRSELKKSLIEVRKWKKRMMDYRKMNLMVSKSCYQQLGELFLMVGTPGEKKKGEEILENCKLLPTHLLSVEDFEKFDKEVIRKLITLTVEMAKKHRSTDKEYLQFLVIKEELIKAHEGIKAADQEIYQCVHNFSTHLENGLSPRYQFPDPSHDFFMSFINHFLFFHELKELQLKTDQANIQKFQAIVDEQFVAAIISKPLIKNPSYLMEIDKLSKEYEDVALDFKLDYSIFEN